MATSQARTTSTRTSTATRSQSQNRRIYGLCNELKRQAGLTDSDLKDLRSRLCREVSGQPSSAELNEAQAERLIRLLEQQLHAPATPVQPTSAQQLTLAALYKQAGFKNAEAQFAWTTKQIGHRWPQNQQELTALLVPLRTMVLRRTNWDEVPARIERLTKHADLLDQWQRRWLVDIRARLSKAPAKSVFSTGRLEKLVEAEAKLLELA